MTRTLTIVILLAILLSVGIAWPFAHGQSVDDEPSEALSPGVVYGTSIIEYGGVLRNRQLTILEGIEIIADAITLNDGIIEAEGNVAVTVIRPDGPTVIMEAEHMTIEEE